MTLERLEREHDNLRAVLRWGREDTDIPLALRAANALATFWQIRGHWTEGRIWLDDLLDFSAAASDAEAMRLRAALHRQAGQLAFLQSDFESATRWAKKCLALCRAQGDRRGAAGALCDDAPKQVRMSRTDRIYRLDSHS